MVNKKLPAARKDGASSISKRTKENTGNSEAGTKREIRSTSERGSASKRSTPQKRIATLPAKLVNDPSILLAQLNDILLAMSVAGWFVHVAGGDKDGLAYLQIVAAPPHPHAISVTGSIGEPVITLDGKEI